MAQRSRSHSRTRGAPARNPDRASQAPRSEKRQASSSSAWELLHVHVAVAAIVERLLRRDRGARGEFYAHWRIPRALRPYGIPCRNPQKVLAECGHVLSRRDFLCCALLLPDF